MDIRKIGIMGGTFNPIHLGHLMIAEEARQHYGLEKVIFIPSYITPNKDMTGAAAEQRLEMTRLATCDNPYFMVSDIEVLRKGCSYTIDTLRYLKKLYGLSCHLFFICGTDTIQDLPNWNDPEQVLDLCEFVGATRPDGTETIDNIIAYFGELGRHIHKLEVPTMELSSTELRYRLQHGMSVRYLLPSKVRDYIIKNEVYLCMKNVKHE